MTDLTDPPGDRRAPSKYVVNFGGARYAGNQDMLRKMAEEMMAAGEKVLWASPHDRAARPAPNPAVVDLAEDREERRQWDRDDLQPLLEIMREAKECMERQGK